MENTASEPFSSSFMASLSFRPKSMGVCHPRHASSEEAPGPSFDSSGREKSRVCRLRPCRTPRRPCQVFHMFEQFVKRKRFIEARQNHVGGLDVHFMSSSSSFAEGSSIMPRPPRPPMPPEPMLFMASHQLGRGWKVWLRGPFQVRKVPERLPPQARSKLTSRESEVECARSLETSRTFRPASASHTAVAEEVVVLPTPPFPQEQEPCHGSAIGGGV